MFKKFNKRFIFAKMIEKQNIKKIFFFQKTVIFSIFDKK